jgi:acetyltransferase-like isoleucine patch superfamily enzyme
MTTLLISLILLVPHPVKRLLLGWLFDWKIDKSARIGLSLFYNVTHVTLGPGARIGHFNVFRNLRCVELGANALIGNWMWITAATMLVDPPYVPTSGCIRVGNEAAVASRHYIDCAGGVEIGDATTVAGIRSTIMTHQISAAHARQTAAPVRIGSHCLISSNVLIAPGAVIPNSCLIAMGATVVNELPSPGMLYAGIPAKPLKKVAQGEYFTREAGFVGL